MADMLTRSERSRLISRISGDDLGPESALRAALSLIGVRFTRNRRDLPGSPDVVVGRLAVFVHGCFWHGCPRHYREPKSRRSFWRRKMSANRARDARARRALNRLGYSVAVIWEHEVKADPDAAARRVAEKAVAALGWWTGGAHSAA